MASPDPEWLLWREQYKSHSKSVAHQLHSLNQATSQIGDVTTRIADLAARSDFLQAQNDVLKQRVLSLEKDANQQDKLNEHLQADNHKFRDRIVHLEQDASQQDQINAMNSQAKGKLEEQLEKLKGDFVNVIEAVETMQKTTTAEREGQRKTVAGMRTRMEAFMATAPYNHPASTGSELRNLASLFPTESRPDRVARELSQATTADDSMQMDLDKETQLLKTTQFSQLPGTTQLYTQYPGEVRPSTIDPNIKMAAQGSSPIEEYVKYGEVVVITGVKQYEVEAVKTFISGLRDKYAQQLLISRLERVGWTWEKAKEEIQRVIEEGRKRKRSRRTMPIFT